MKKLPLGLQTFRKLIKQDCVYVDKTRDILELIQSGTYFFLSRPRRFGKSLLVSTLYEIFSGNQELFQGLHIYDKIEWKPHPVIHLDLSLISKENEEQLKQSLMYVVESIASEHHIKLGIQKYNMAFRELIIKLSEAYQQQVVVLIDEYDKPIIDLLENVDAAHKNREVLKKFYGILKGCDPYLRFVFLTGVSKFARVSIFSGLNNLKDITLTPQFAMITGYTQEELERDFDAHLAVVSETSRMSQEELLELIKFWYNGYSWDGKRTLYNPFSILNFFMDQDFGNYWFASGTPTFLLKKIREQQIDITGLEKQTLGVQSLDSYDIERLETYALLFQTGYLTIKGIKRARMGARSYILSYPNFEVRESLLTYLCADFTAASVAKIQPLHEQMFTYLEQEDLEAFIQMMQSLFSDIPYPLHISEEAYYHSLFYMIMKLMGAEVNAEVLTDKGRVDAVLECDDRIYVIECKYGESGRKVETLTRNALRQIHAKKYYEPFLKKGKKILLLGIGFVEKTLGYQIEALKE